MNKLFSLKHNLKFKHILIIFILFSFYIFISAYSYADTVSAGISQSVFRLHVIANSDSKEDQALKYKVRDELISYMNSLSDGITNKEEVIKLAKLHKSDFESVAKKVIQDNGFDYNVTVEIGNFDFPTKVYGDISLPSGYYDALKVEIGNAAGRNWWCVMFPPLCFVDVTSGIVPDESKEIMKEELTDEEYKLISDQDDR